MRRSLVWVLTVCFYLLATVPPAIAGDKWWMPAEGQDTGSVWNYRIPVTVAAPGELSYSDYPIEIPVDFNLLLESLKSKGTLDLPNSLRLISQDGTREAPLQYDDNRYKDAADETGNGRGNMVFVLGGKDTVLKAGSSIKYYLYFDVVENGLKKASSYAPVKAMVLNGHTGIVDTGKIAATIGLSGGNDRNGIKAISLSDGDAKIKIPLYGYGIDSLGKGNAPLTVELEKGAVAARFYFHEEATNTTDKDAKQPGQPLFSGCFTFFNNSGIYYLDLSYPEDKRLSLTNFMVSGFFTSFQDNTMSEPMALTKDALCRNVGARYGVAINEKAGFATWLPEKGALTWNTRKGYNMLPSFSYPSNSCRVKHSLDRGGIELGKALDVPPSVFLNPNQTESIKK
ncbi:MAG: hypothetical protein PHT33_02200 [bacterium]|nr:hypothetical protein [bacterium]